MTGVLISGGVFNFQRSREVIGALLKCHLSEDEFQQTVGDQFKSMHGSDGEKKSAVDQAFKDAGHRMVGTEGIRCDQLKQLVTLAVLGVRIEMCSASTPFVLLSDIFDDVTLDKCSDMFEYVEQRVSTWKSALLHTAGKNYLLRMCNDLLRRLSKSQNTLFCGRIQLFLARLFPLSEKSGLNLMSQFNLDNMTVFSLETECLAELSTGDAAAHDVVPHMETDDADKSAVPIDYNLYKKFWSLQDFFRKPTQCYDKTPWKNFTDYAQTVFDCFSSYKLDDITTQKVDAVVEGDETLEHTYFAKYLTSEKLLNLQLSDASFRRYVLVQFLMIFQYLQATCKFKSPAHILTDEASEWVKTSTATIYALLRETPPHGDVFAKAIEHLLAREENWSSWKNDCCLPYVREKAEVGPLPVKRSSLGEELHQNPKTVKLGNGELTRLWNLAPDNVAACHADSRNYMPSLQTFFEDAIEQADPEQGVEEQYKLVQDPTWCWKALRLLSRFSPTFFTPASGSANKTLHEFLDHTVTKMAGEAGPAPVVEKVVCDQASREREETELEESEATGRAEGTRYEIPEPSAKITSVGQKSGTISDQQILLLAEIIGKHWSKLATRLKFAEDEITYWKEKHTEVAEQGASMLRCWVEQTDAPLLTTLKLELEAAGLTTAADKLSG